MPLATDIANCREKYLRSEHVPQSLQKFKLHKTPIYLITTNHALLRKDASPRHAHNMVVWSGMLSSSHALQQEVYESITWQRQLLTWRQCSGKGKSRKSCWNVTQNTPAQLQDALGSWDHQRKSLPHLCAPFWQGWRSICHTNLCTCYSFPACESRRYHANIYGSLWCPR